MEVYNLSEDREFEATVKNLLKMKPKPHKEKDEGKGEYEPDDKGKSDKPA